ncbi:MAG: hypothetical protein JEY79_03595 [Pseudodesulfovibrio sp.]|nr:hypothetical protein [Pseudodesulfovibrio sp.]
MFDFGKSLINMNPDEQKKMLDNATSGQRNMALEMGIGFNKPKPRQQPKQQKQDAYHDLDRLNTIVEKENEAHDFFGKGLNNWQKNVTGNRPSKDATTLKKQFDEYEHGILSDLPKGGTRHGALSETLPKIKNGFLKQGHQFALNKLNERSRSILDNGLQRIAKGALGAKDEKGIQAHDDQAFDLINKYVISEAKFDEKDADTMYDKYLSYSGFEPQAADGPDAGQASGQKNQRESLVEKGNTETPKKTPTKSSAQQTREMEAKAEKTRPDNSTKAARLVGEWEKQTGNSAEDVDKHYIQQPGNKPTWMKEILGKTEYYEQRAKDFEERNPGKKAPDYYREYGDKYVKRFDKLKPELSEKGQKWQEKAKDLLQFKMEQGLRSGKWDESKPDELEKKAFDSHSKAYLEAGLADLPDEDIGKIMATIDLLDMIDPDALEESIQVARELGIKKSFGSVLSGVVGSVSD